MGHTDTISSLQVSPDSQYLLSNAHDSTVRTWDIRPFAPADRAVRTYDGAPTGLEKNLFRASWDSTGKKIAAGSGDRSVAVWDVVSGKLLNKLPGHKGAVNDVRFHPGGEPISKCCIFILLKAYCFVLLKLDRKLYKGVQRSATQMRSAIEVERERPKREHRLLD
jgi:WD40 repeat protein